MYHFVLLSNYIVSRKEYITRIESVVIFSSQLSFFQIAMTSTSEIIYNYVEARYKTALSRQRMTEIGTTQCVNENWKETIVSGKNHFQRQNVVVRLSVPIRELRQA